MENVTKHWIGK